MKNQEVADIFNEIAQLLEIQDENPFRIRAYLRAAQNIRELTQDIEKIAQSNELENLPGIGHDLAGKISEIVTTGCLKYLEELRKQVPAAIIKFMTIPGVGPKTAKLLHEKLAAETLDDLEKLARSNKIAGLPGIKEKTQENIIKGIELHKRFADRTLLPQAMLIAEEITTRLKKLPAVQQVEVAGSLRRRKETVHDIDILATAANAAKVMQVFTTLPQTKQVLAKGETKSAIITREGMQVDVRVVSPQSFGAALCYFTGSKEHNIHLRDLAKKKGLKINEYGVFKGEGKTSLAGKTEEEVYRILGLKFIEPELREDHGEIDYAAKNRLPVLIKEEDIKGDLHVHTNLSDGAYKLEDVVEAAIKKGYKYMAITDHSQGLGVAGGLKKEELFRSIKKMRALNKKYPGFKILAGSEVDIKADGKMDYPDEVLKELDVVVGAVHSGFKQPQEVMTKRIIRAMQNKYVQIIAHPSGRLIGEREPYALDWDDILKAAKDTNTALEINSYPKRLDLIDIFVRRAKEEGIKLVISTDSHLIEQLNYMRLGVYVARRGWCEKKDILNTLAVEQLLKRLRK